MPVAGDDGARGIGVLTGIRLALGSGRVVAQDSANGGFLNPHRDEGSDNDADVGTAPLLIAAFAADGHIVAAIGGLRRNVGDAVAAQAESHRLPVLLLSRWSRNGRSSSSARSQSDANAFCLCVSPPRLVAFARTAARERFGWRLTVVLIGEAEQLAATWPAAFSATATARVGDGGAALEAARRKAVNADAVLVIADERPAALWRSDVFRRRFDAAYLRQLGHRDFRLVPDGTPRGGIVVLHEIVPDSPARRSFEQRFRAAAGFLPGTEAAMGYAAGQILRADGNDRASVRDALRHRRFDTVAGPVAFDADGYRSTANLAASAP
ncbi:MAG: Periplasmic binding protein [Candidatus Eremiobacteraeota bacterium]|nr:Periplasmic binding protein [Candidatus Eremiobacteraeota bacterium]